ncbi:MAG: hypothetical protein JO307_10115 [Bryobacterales bacterium]|nr:hypothetical protein [Bryobacterales bacterium]MBV9397579.1 hypothetical protein [Bryobacterales bacterium]
MPVFPQITMYPLVRQLNLRTVVNTLPDGSTVVYTDPDASARAWEWQAKGLTAAEWTSIEAFFRSASGQWQTFTFVDPAGNLLAESENFSAGAWANGALIQLTSGISDPFGTTRATHIVNAGRAAQAVQQTLPVPENFRYALSVWARGGAGSNLTLIAGAATLPCPLTTQWRRVWFPVNLGQGSVGVTFGLQLNPGGAVDIFGMQVDAQTAPSDYKMTGATGGVYLKARFATDAITVQAQSTDVYDATIRIMSTEG